MGNEVQIMRYLVILVILFQLTSVSTFGQRKLKVEVIIHDDSQCLLLNYQGEKGDVIYLSEDFAYSNIRFDTTQLKDIEQKSTFLPQFSNSALYILNDTSAYLYEYDEESNGIDSTDYEIVQTYIEDKGYYYAGGGNNKRNYKYKIPIWIAPKILSTNPKEAVFYLKVRFDQQSVTKEVVLFDMCKIEYR